MRTAVNRPEKRSFSLFCIIAALIFVAAPLTADELDEARAFEREGRTDEARKAYLDWLDAFSNRNDGRFGRTLLHLIRMPGSAEEDLGFLERYLPTVPPGEDRAALIEYALALCELMGKDSRRYREQLPDKQAPEDGIFGRLPPGRGELLSDPVVTPGDGGSGDFLLYLAYNDWSRDELISWAEKAHALRPGLLDSPEWIYLLIRSLRRNGLGAEAEEYRMQLMSRFPESLEADLLTGRVSLLPSPADLLSGDADKAPYSEEGRDGIGPPQAGASDAGPSTSSSDETAGEASVAYIQVGAFGKRENARSLRDSILREGLDCRISEEDAVYKVILLSRDESETAEIMKKLDLKGFRIPRIP